MTLLITGVIAIFSTMGQAQSADRKLWPRTASDNKPVPDQTAERVPVGENRNRVSGSDRRCAGVFDIFEQQKRAIVGSWLGHFQRGKQDCLNSQFRRDYGSFSAGGVSTIPEFGVLTPGHAVWKHLGGRQFGLTSLSVNYDINRGAFMGMLN